jgi:hypothetical protein
VSIAGLVAGAPTALAAHTANVAPARAATTPTRFALEASGFASRALGGQVPAESDKVAYTVVACTNSAGRSRSNSELEGELGDGLTFEGAATRAWTTKVDDTVSAWSRQHIAEVTLGGTSLGDLSLVALTSTTRTWHDSTGFHATTTSSLGRIVIHPATGDDQVIAAPAPGQVVTAPGVAEIRLGAGVTKRTASSAAGSVDAVRITLLPTDTVVYLAHSRASIYGGVKSKMYGGHAYATQASLLDGSMTSGRTVPTPVPCIGSGNEWTGNGAANATLADDVVGRGLRSRQRSGITPSGHPAVTTTARVGLVDLGNGLIVSLIHAQAQVVKTAAGYLRSSRGTSVGSVVFNGDEQTFPHTGVLEIPGVAKLERAVVERGKRSVSVTALRITLLDGTGAVIDLGNADALLRPSGV